MSAPSRTRDFWKLFGIGLFCLLVSAWVLKSRLKNMVTENTTNRTLLEETSPGFNTQTIPQIKREIDDLQSRLYATAVLFNPQDRWLRKGYDVSILFVEELNNANEFLKQEAAKMQVEFPGFTFSEKLPSEAEAAKLLTQLNGIREVINVAIDRGADVIDVKPLEITESETFSQGVLLPCSLELRMAHAKVTEFLLNITGIVPKITVDSLKVKVEEEYVEVLLDFSTIYTDLRFSDEAQSHLSVGNIPTESYPPGMEPYISVLRSVSPFAMPIPKVAVSAATEAAADVQSVEEAKPAQRFFFRGRANLRGKDVAVIEDTMKQETIFLTRGENYERFRLKDFSDDGAILESIDNEIITIINWEEQ